MIFNIFSDIGRLKTRKVTQLEKGFMIYLLGNNLKREGIMLLIIIKHASQTALLSIK